MPHIAIIGNGISGITAARFIRKLDSDARITVISGETDFFFSRTALMYIYMGHMRYEDTKPYEDWFWDKNRIELVRAWVTDVDFDTRILTLQDTSDEKPIPSHTLSYDKLIIATGSSSNMIDWPGVDLEGVQGLYSKQDLDRLERTTANIETAAVVGGGLIGIELAEMLHSRGIDVKFMVREECFWNHVLPKEESEMVSGHIRKHGIDLMLSTKLKEIRGDSNGRVSSILTAAGEEIYCQFAGITIGVHPNIQWLREISGHPELAKGILVNEYLETNIPDVYAVGDCAQLKDPDPGRRPIEPIWYTGRMMGEIAAYNACGRKERYTPGIWFNSAKFVDIEYQVYGDSPHISPEGYDSIHWEDPHNDRSIRINYEIESKRVTGFTLLGVRYRHELCEEWIRSQTPLDEVLQSLEAANFDPEFYKIFEPELRREYESKTGLQLAGRSGRGFGSFKRLLKSLTGHA